MFVAPYPDPLEDGVSKSVVWENRTPVTRVRGERPGPLDEHDQEQVLYARQGSNLRTFGSQPNDLPLIYARIGANDGTRTHAKRVETSRAATTLRSRRGLPGDRTQLLRFNGPSHHQCCLKPFIFFLA